jgi:hypothetical protein
LLAQKFKTYLPFDFIFEYCGDVIILSALYVPAYFINAISLERTYFKSLAAGELIYKTGYFYN